ncbi:MAG: cytochrome c [Myxococcota bacterium]|nr:cytochrome c [Myxococcota bacterium]
MLEQKSLIVSLALGTFALGLTGCPTPNLYTEAQVLGGQSIPADTLNLGYRSYVKHCYACHGMDGDGRGPAAPGLDPAPRDLRAATYKFAWVQDGLPHDDDIKRILTDGLHGTAMLEWELPDLEFDAVVQYIKTFSPEGEGWKDPDETLGDKVAMTEVTVAEADMAEAIEQGKSLYHTDGNCWKCHPAYATRDYIYEQGQLRDVNPSFDDQMYDSKLQKETNFVANGAKVNVLPPDYTFSAMRVSHDVESIYKTVRGGLGGGLMPAHDNFPEEDILAIAYYVDSLMKLGAEDPVAAGKLRQDLRDSLATPWTAPEPPAEEGAEGEGDSGE